MTKTLLYVADPMCSWCWGFSPVITRVVDDYGSRAPMQVMVGGLRPGNTKIMDEEQKGYIREHWHHVQEASGQPFDFTFFDQDGFIYDTEPACRAVVVARKLEESKTLSFLNSLHGAFYRDKRNITSVSELGQLAAESGFDQSQFEQEMHSEEVKEETRGDFWFTQKSGITGFPTLLAVEDKKASLVTAGFRKWDDVSAILDQWLAA